METILITGGTGLVGRALTKALLAKGYKVIVMGRGRKGDGEPGAGSSL
ncbi:MAG TPA: NAD-dependent epimerase/dehydratase family protein, partial [Chitinophagaceae bacterium]|nr:NAD-dependent epimerase/dehydratase family protein [Chitinophagaceae bacterium]